MEGSSQFSHRRLKILVKKCWVLDAFRRSLVGPPLSLIGNSTCVGGFMSRGAAFSGLPILTPTLVENLFLIFIPDDFEIISGTEESESFGVFLNNRLKKIFASSSSRITSHFLFCEAFQVFQELVLQLTEYWIVSSSKFTGLKKGFKFF